MLLDLIEAATEEGPLRRLMPQCRVGRRVNALRDTMHPRPNETGDSYYNRLYRKVKTATAQEGCTDYDSCVTCPRGRDILTQAAAEDKMCLPEHAEAVFAAMTVTGEERPLPNSCSIGRTMNSLLENGDIDDRGNAVVAALGEQYHCSTMTSCAHCPLGRGVIEQLLVDLAENGMKGEAGEVLRDSYHLLR